MFGYSWYAHTYIYTHIHPYDRGVCVYTNMFAYLSIIYGSINQSIYLSVCLFIYLSICLYNYIHMYYGGR